MRKRIDWEDSQKPIGRAGVYVGYLDEERVDVVLESSGRLGYTGARWRSTVLWRDQTIAAHGKRGGILEALRWAYKALRTVRQEKWMQDEQDVGACLPSEEDGGSSTGPLRGGLWSSD